MSSRIVPAGLLIVAAAGLCLAVRAAADESKKDAEPPAGDLALEVNALRTLYYFKATPEQLRLLKKLAHDTADKPRERKVKVSQEYREALGDLREALIDARDEDRIDNLDDKLDQLRESEKPDLDDGVDITAAARKRAPELFRQLKPSQVAAYIAQVSDEVIDPLDHLREALGQVRGWKASAWKAKRDEVAEQIGNLIAGLDADRAGRIQDEVKSLLDTARGLKDDEFKAQQPKLEKRAEEIVGDVASTDVLRHTVEYALAELLSNPRLEAAVDARLK
jgi:hypothetical protein